MPAPVRMKDIARDLGVSTMAVSKALRGHRDIGEDLRARVLARATEVGYRVDQVARSMATGRTYLVGLVVPDLMQSFFAEIATELEARLAPAGYHVLISHTKEDAADEVEDVAILVSRKVDGLVIATAQGDGAQLRALDIPYVLIDRDVPGLDANAVGSDGVELGRLATAHLVAQGCRRVAHLAGHASPAAAARQAGWALALAGETPGPVIEAGHDDAAGHAAMRALLTGGERPDGVFCFNDPVAVGAMRAVREAGLRVPDDVAVIGAGNMHYGDALWVGLCTIDQDTAAIAREAANLLLDLMTAPAPLSPRRVTPPLTLVARGSSLRANGTA